MEKSVGGILIYKNYSETEPEKQKTEVYICKIPPKTDEIEIKKQKNNAGDGT